MVLDLPNLINSQELAGIQIAVIAWRVHSVLPGLGGPAPSPSLQREPGHISAFSVRLELRRLRTG